MCIAIMLRRILAIFFPGNHTLLFKLLIIILARATRIFENFSARVLQQSRRLIFSRIFGNENMIGNEDILRDLYRRNSICSRSYSVKR